MFIEYIAELDLLKVTSTEITNFIENIGDFTAIEATATLNCTDTPLVQEYDTTEVLSSSNKFYIDTEEETLLVSPLLFGLTAYVDGIYKLSFKLKTSSGFTLIANCLFVDITYKCKVASLLQNIIAENKTTTGEKVSTIAHLLHYSLFNGSNCGCNCEELCYNFVGLTSILDSLTVLITNDCGCQ